MPIQLQFRRGNTIQNSSFVGAEGEVTVDTSKKTIVVHDGSTTGGNPLTTSADLTTANVSESGNLYFTNARVYSNVIGLLNTNTVVEGSNQYFTNARARAALSSGTGVNFNSSTGAISISQNVDSTANVTFQNILVTGNLTVTGNTVSLGVTSLAIEDNMIYLNANSEVSNPDLGFAGNYNDGSYKHAGLFRDATDGVWKFFDSYTLEPDASAFIDTGNTSFRLSNVQVTNLTGNVTGTITSIANHTTSNLSEGSNLYFTNTRAIGAITGGAGITIAANGRITSTETFTGTINSIAGVTTGSVSNAQLYAGAAAGGTIGTITTIAGVSTGSVSNAQLYAGAAAGGTIGTITSVGGVSTGTVSNAQIYAAAANGGTIGTLTTGKSIAMALVFGG